MGIGSFLPRFGGLDVGSFSFLLRFGGFDDGSFSLKYFNVKV
jgi:hypothetical protein